MTTKTFKIGESCKGGVITVEIDKGQITIIGKDWDFSKGSNKSSDQSQAEEFTRLIVSLEDTQAYRTLLDFLCDLTTSYYAEEILGYIGTKSGNIKQLFW